jgi:hypothetical protein
MEITMEEARLEENKRFDTERQILERLAPEKWAEMKEVFRHECARVSERSHRSNFECDDPTPKTFYVSRIINGLALEVLTLRFDSSVPRIVFDIRGVRPKHGSVDFLVCGSALVFANGKSGVALPEFVLDTLMHIMR